VNDLSYFKNKKINGKKITLRPMQKKDASYCVKWLSDPEVNKFLNPNIKNLTEQQELEWLRNRKNSGNDIIFAIDVKETGCYIGNCGLHNIDLEAKICEFGIFIGDKDCWNRGYGTDTTKTAVNFALSDLGLETVRLKVYEYNHRAISVYKNCGFIIIDILKKHHFYNELYWDEFVMQYSKYCTQ